LNQTASLDPPTPNHPTPNPTTQPPPPPTTCHPPTPQPPKPNKPHQPKTDPNPTPTPDQRTENPAGQDFRCGPTCGADRSACYRRRCTDSQTIAGNQAASQNAVFVAHSKNDGVIGWLQRKQRRASLKANPREVERTRCHGRAAQLGGGRAVAGRARKIGRANTAAGVCLSVPT